MSIRFDHARDHLQQFDFRRLFVEELGWSQPVRRSTFEVAVKGRPFVCRQVAELAGAVVLEVEATDGGIPDARTRAEVHKEIAKQHHENLLIFIDHERSQSLWYWVKRQDGKAYPREHLYCRGQPGDLFLTKLNQMVFDLADFDAEGNVSIVEVARRLQGALDVERVTKRFFRDFEEQHIAFLELIGGIDDDRDRRWYASVLLNRLMFIYFLQKKPPGFLDNGNQNYLRDKLVESRQRGKDRYYSVFLNALFFEGFAKPEEKRSETAKKLIGKIRYLNGGLFLHHRIERNYHGITVPDQAFENLFNLFERYTWHLDDTPGGKDDEINPDVLGYIFEKYINQKAFGAYYTRTEITDYLCERTIHQSILDAVNTPDAGKTHPIPGVRIRAYASLGDLLMDLDASLCRRLLREVLPGLSILDPACGSGAFLVAAMKTLINVYSAVVGRVKFLQDKELTAWLQEMERGHRNVGYVIKKRIITDNLYGVDVMEEATEIARLRLFLALVASARTVEELEPLPNIDFNILAGNSLIGLMRVNEAEFEKRTAQGHLFRKSYKQVLEEKNRLIDNFRHATDYADDLGCLRDTIDERKREAYETLNDILLGEFQRLGIKYEQATWDTAKRKEGKPIKRPMKPEDIEALHPFHWGFEFDNVLNNRGGFDVVITNPPWETFQPDAKEFFAEYSNLVSKKKMDIKAFESEQARLLRDPEVMRAWLEYHSRFNHQRQYYRISPEYENQVPVIEGKRHGKDVNLFKLFLERCFHLLRPKGECGIVLPSGIYTDLGAKKLREMLFSMTNITGLFGFENRKEVFEGVHRSYKFVVLTFQQGGPTGCFPAAFMRHNVSELRIFPQNAMEISVETVRRLSPNSLSLMEFGSEVDLTIAEKMHRWPLLGEELSNGWNIELHREFNMTDDATLFDTTPGSDRLPLYEGKMIHQFTSQLAPARYWISEKRGRAALLGREADKGQFLPYSRYRLAFRDVARNTDGRTMIATLLPPNVFTVNTLVISVKPTNVRELVGLVAILNSFAFDFLIRQRVTAHCNMFYVYQMPVPREPFTRPAFDPIVVRAARLLFKPAELQNLVGEFGLSDFRQVTTTPTEQVRLRAELDGLIAHLYNLTEAEFAHVLNTFPLAPDPVKIAAQNAYRDVERGLVR